LASTLKSIGFSVLEGCPVENLTLPYLGINSSIPLKISFLTDSQRIYSLTITNAKKLPNNFLSEMYQLRELTISCPLKNASEKTFAGSEQLIKVRLTPELEEYAQFFPEGRVTYIGG
jgi:hypothetical protein